jgi:hypothetical protein
MACPMQAISGLLPSLIAPRYMANVRRESLLGEEGMRKRSQLNVPSRCCAIWPLIFAWEGCMVLCRSRMGGPATPTL